MEVPHSTQTAADDDSDTLSLLLPINARTVSTLCSIILLDIGREMLTVNMCTCIVSSSEELVEHGDFGLVPECELMCVSSLQ